MWYKEWTVTRFKFYLIVVSFLIAGFAIVFSWLNSTPRPGFRFFSLINTWLTVCAVITVIAGIMASADIISEENSKGTLSFLLSRPISRSRIYITKLAMNAGLLCVVITLVNLVFFLVDNLRSFPNDVWVEKPVTLLEVLGYTGLINLAGIAVLCLGGMLSVFTQNGLQTAGIALGVILLGLGFFIYTLAQYARIYYDDSTVTYNFSWDWWPFTVALILATLAVGFFWIGLRAFTRKQF